MRLLREYFPNAMRGKSFTAITREQEKQKGKGDKLQHRWMFGETLAFSKEKGMFWLVYVEGEGMYYLLCRIHNTRRKFNKDSKFNSEPSVHFKRTTILNNKAQPGDKKDLGHAQAARLLSTLVLNWNEERVLWCNNIIQSRRKQTKWHSVLCWVHTGSLMKRLPMSSSSPSWNFKNKLDSKRLGIGKMIVTRISEAADIITGAATEEKGTIPTAKWFSILVDEVTDC